MSEAGKFTDDILKAANAKAQQLISEAESETQKALEASKSDISIESQEIIRTAQSEAEGVKRRYLSEVRHRLKLKEQEEKSKILTQVLDDVRKRIFNITEDAAKYESLLVSLIEKGVRELALDKATIHLNATDMKRFQNEKLESEVARKAGQGIKLEWSKNPVEVVGGAVVSSLDGRIRIVNTLEGRLAALEQRMLTEAGRLLFEEK